MRLAEPNFGLPGAHLGSGPWAEEPGRAERPMNRYVVVRDFGMWLVVVVPPEGHGSVLGRWTDLDAAERDCRRWVELAVASAGGAGSAAGPPVDGASGRVHPGQAGGPSETEHRRERALPAAARATAIAHEERSP